MIRESKQSWKQCKYSVRVYEPLTDYYNCINKEILGFKTYSEIAFRKGDNCLFMSAILFKHSDMTIEDRLKRLESEAESKALQDEIDKGLAFCKVCKFYEPKEKFAQLTIDKNLKLNSDT